MNWSHNFFIVVFVYIFNNLQIIRISCKVFIHHGSIISNILLISYLLVLFSLCKHAILSFDFRWNMTWTCWYGSPKHQRSAGLFRIQSQRQCDHWPDSSTKFQHIRTSQRREHGENLWQLVLGQFLSVWIQHHLPTVCRLGMFLPERRHHVSLGFYGGKPHQVRTLRIFLFL